MSFCWEDARKRLYDKIASLPDSDRAWEFFQDFVARWEQEGSAYLYRVWVAVRYQEILLKTLKAINSEHDTSRLLHLIIDKAIELTGAERGFLLVEDQKIARNFTGEDICGDYKISLSVAKRVRESGTPILSDNAQFDPELASCKSIQEHRLLSILCVPVIIQNRPTGVIYVDNRLVRGSFKEEHVELLMAFSDQAAVALANARLHQELMERSQELHLLNEQLHNRVQEQEQEIRQARKQWSQLAQKYHYHNIYTRNPRMQQIFSTLEKIKNYDIPVLIQGESGTGKELVARAIHSSGIRKEKAFLSENCAAIAESLFESELFGYEKGAFTGAQQQKKGLFEEADGGTLFLDEIGELSLELQKKLLRVLAEKSIRRVGGQQSIPVDVRIITATNRDLKDMVDKGEFREDLYYRLNGVSIYLPPLRERREDIPILVEYFLKEAAEMHGEKVKSVEPTALSLLRSYDWPGNIRQLRNEIFRLHALCSDVITAASLSEEILSKKNPNLPNNKVHNLNQLLREVEKEEILKALQWSGNNKSRAAQLLGISRFTLQRKLDKWGL